MIREPISLLAALPSKTGELLRLAQRADAGLSAIQQLAQEVGPFLKCLSADVGAMKATTERMDSHVAEIHQEITEFSRRLTGIEELVASLARDVDEATDHLPEPNKGPVAKAKEIISGSSTD